MISSSLGQDEGQVDRVNGSADMPYTDIWVYKSGKRPKSISFEKMLYLEGGERLCTLPVMPLPYLEGLSPITEFLHVM